MPCGAQCLLWRFERIIGVAHNSTVKHLLHPAFLIAVVFLPLAGALADAEAIARNTAFMEQAQRRWRQSPDGAWLERILPPAMAPDRLPEADSRGAALMTRYCVQCHHLPNPAMHAAASWPRVVDRMVLRMRGKGNIGTLMKHMMGGLRAPDEEEIHVLTAYLQRHAQRPIERARYADLRSGPGRSFDLACSQCHALPDPRSHRRGEWRDVVRRMEGNMAWMNRVAGSKHDPDEPQLRVEDIVSFLERHAPR